MIFSLNIFHNIKICLFDHEKRIKRNHNRFHCLHQNSGWSFPYLVRSGARCAKRTERSGDLLFLGVGVARGAVELDKTVTGTLNFGLNCIKFGMYIDFINTKRN